MHARTVHPLTQELHLPSHHLARLGWRADLQDHLDALGDPALVCARVLAQDRGALLLDDGSRQWRASPAGALRHAAAGAEDLPAVGDWVAAAPLGPVRALLPRRGTLARPVEGGRQVLAANVDLALIATSLNRDLNPRRVERLLAVTAAGGVDPLVLATKADLSADVAEDVEALRRAIGGVPVLPVSALTGAGLEALGSLLRPGTTAALLGSSGVGKTTLRNRLTGGDAPTAPVREHDDRGRHTTVRRELVALPGGALLIDTPGLRLVGVDGGLEAAFADVEQLAARCRFADCRHGSEPGCAVRAAIEAGQLDPKHLRSRQRLSVEAARRGDTAYRREQRRTRRARGR